MNKSSSIHEKGQTLVELALLLPVLVLLTVVTFDLGRGIYYYSTIYSAAREGARYGIVHQQPSNTIPDDTAGIETIARNRAVGLDPSQLIVSVVSPIVGNTLQVNVNYSFELVTPLAQVFTGRPCGCITLSTSSTMLIER